MKKRAIVYWLVPAKEERELFQEIIRILCRELDAPKFGPHLTLFVAKEQGGSPKRILQKFSGSTIRLRVRGVAFSPKYTKTLFVRFKPSGGLKRLVSHLGRAVKTRAKVPRDPHLSLVYKRRISAATEKELAATIKLPLREVLFDSIEAVRLTLPVQNRRDVESWRVVARKRLRSKRVH